MKNKIKIFALLSFLCLSHLSVSSNSNTNQKSSLLWPCVAAATALYSWSKMGGAEHEAQWFSKEESLRYKMVPVGKPSAQMISDFKSINESIQKIKNDDNENENQLVTDINRQMTHLRLKISLEIAAEPDAFDSVEHAWDRFLLVAYGAQYDPYKVLRSKEDAIFGINRPLNYHKRMLNAGLLTVMSKKRLEELKNVSRSFANNEEQCVRAVADKADTGTFKDAIDYKPAIDTHKNSSKFWGVSCLLAIGAGIHAYLRK